MIGFFSRFNTTKNEQGIEPFTLGQCITGGKKFANKFAAQMNLSVDGQLYAVYVFICLDHTGMR